MQNLYTIEPNLVGIVGFEPTAPEGTGLQPAAALQLCRIPKFFTATQAVLDGLLLTM